MAAVRRRKRFEAELRNERTLPTKRRAYWREVAADAVAEPPTVCAFQWKDRYENEDAARAALHGMPRHRKRQGLHPYPCAGHWHLGRMLRRATVAWKAVA